MGGRGARKKLYGLSALGAVVVAKVRLPRGVIYGSLGEKNAVVIVKREDKQKMVQFREIIK